MSIGNPIRVLNYRDKLDPADRATARRLTRLRLLLYATAMVIVGFAVQLASMV